MATHASLDPIGPFAPRLTPVDSLHVSLDGQLPRSVDDLSIDGFTVIGGLAVPDGTFLHATFTVARCLSITIPALSEGVTAAPSGEIVQSFRFASNDPSLVDLLICTAPSVVVH